ncbi:MAG: RelA/SpoT family protein [Bacteroidales bacterium]
MLKTDTDLSFRERRRIYRRYLELINSAKGILKEQDKELLRSALDITLQNYESERLPNGEPYVFHLLEVARIVAQEIGLSAKSMLASMLYDLVKKQKITLKEVEKKFGKKVSQIIAGLIKILEIKTSQNYYEPENFRKLLLSLSDDVRVILIRLAILVDEMRRMNYMPKDYQIKTSLQTQNLFAPLAHRLGLYSLKSELEDLSMKYTEHETYRYIIKKLKDTTAKRNRFIKKFIDPIKKELTAQGFDFEIKGRTKSVHSIWRKMKKQNVPFEQVYDIFAIRIIVDSERKHEKADCWRVYSIVTDFYKPNPERLRDWISIPKSNGYESLHTTVIGPEGKWVEVQIRSRRMNEIAEKGYAAHWKYKGIRGDKAFDDWMSKIRDLLEISDAGASEIIDNFKIDFNVKEIFVFTPKGELKKLPEGSTVLDFAFEIHSEVGAKCVGGIVNNMNVSIKEKLKNGDRVEIITSKKQKPKVDWLNVVVTSKAKAKIKQTLKEEQSKEAETGKELLKRRLKNWKIHFSQDILNKLLKHYNMKEATDFFSALAVEKIDITEIKDILTHAEDEEQQTEKSFHKEIPQQTSSGKETSDYIIVDGGVKNVDYKLAKCCNPIYGDEIIGFISVNEGIKIHRVNCHNAQRLISKYNYRIIKAEWGKSIKKQSFQTRIKVSGIDEIGIVNKISDIISNNMKVRMRSISFDSNDGIFEGFINLYVEDTKHLEALIRKLKKEKAIIKVTRMDMKE